MPRYLQSFDDELDGTESEALSRVMNKFAKSSDFVTAYNNKEAMYFIFWTGNHCSEYALKDCGLVDQATYNKYFG